jgi:ubiquinone/menaquinone biosynthesis C-methylase UbiE
MSASAFTLNTSYTGDNKMSDRVCPWWLGYLLASPLRRLLQDPEAIMRPYVRKGMTVLDAGCGMGFFSLPLANLVGDAGKVICIDLQDRMIRGLMRRAGKARLSDRIDARVCRQDSLGVADMAGKIDFAVVFALVHEVPDKKRLLSEVYATLKRDGKLLIAEPKGHVSRLAFEKTVDVARSEGFEVLNDLAIRRSRAVLLRPR